MNFPTANFLRLCDDISTGAISDMSSPALDVLHERLHQASQAVADLRLKNFVRAELQKPQPSAGAN
jgi:hypothetical protein